MLVCVTERAVRVGEKPDPDLLTWGSASRFDLHALPEVAAPWTFCCRFGVPPFLLS